jgi:hypothetical protein
LFRYSLQLASLRIRDGLLDGVQDLGMHIAPSGDDAIIVLERSTLGKVERLAVHVGAYSAGFRDEERARGVVLWTRSARGTLGQRGRLTQIFSSYALPPMYFVGILKLRTDQPLSPTFREKNSLSAPLAPPEAPILGLAVHPQAPALGHAQERRDPGLDPVRRVGGLDGFEEADFGGGDGGREGEARVRVRVDGSLKGD